MRPEEKEFRRVAFALGLARFQIDRLCTVAFPRYNTSSQAIVRTINQKQARALADRVNKTSMSKDIIANVIWKFLSHNIPEGVDPGKINLPDLV